MKTISQGPHHLIILAILAVLMTTAVGVNLLLTYSTYDGPIAPPISATIAITPKPAAINHHDDPTKIDVLVNKKHPLKPLNFVPDLVTIDGATLQPEAANAWHQMKLAAANDNVTLTTNSSYRSYITQVETYNHWSTVNGSSSVADQVSARPGYSEHQTGLALDISTGSCTLDCFNNSASYRWLVNNGYKFGFVQRYQAGEESVTGYSAENWHWRYVGVDTATDMRNKNIKTLEEYWGISGGNYAN